MQLTIKTKTKTKEISTKVITKELTETDCRKRHVSIHNPNLEVHHCPYCVANVVANDNFDCTCCGHHVPKVAKNNYARLEKVLNKAQREYGELADGWASFPTKKPVTLEIGIGSQVYKIDIKYVAFWNEALPKIEKLAYIHKHYRLYGLRVWIPDDDID